MKQHNDRHPVLDALGRLDEEAIHACLQEDVSPRMTVSRATLCRRVAVAAACLALTAAVGLTALLPLMRPGTPGVEGTDHTVNLPENGEEYPFVKLQVLSYNENETEDGERPVTIIDDEATQLISYHNLYLHLQFNCAEGETVTVVSHDTDGNDMEEQWQSVLERLEEFEPQDAQSALTSRLLMRHLHALLKDSYNCLVKLDSDTYMWCFPTRTDQVPEENYDVVSFVIRNENGEITGAGSVCIGIYSARYNRQLRSEILGAERFDPAIGEEAATAYLASLEATAAEAYAGMDFSPQSDEEGYAIAAALAKSQVAHTRGRTLVEYGYGCQFRCLTFTENGDSDVKRRFLLFPDGTYAEVAPEGFAAYDGILEQFHSPTGNWDFSDVAVLLTDGRIVTFRGEPITPPDDKLPKTKWCPVFAANTEETV